jgi:hypothetical protein
MRAIAIVQACYFLLTGVWPIVHMRSFLAVTGPKVDLWLVKTVGVLVAMVGSVLLMAAWSGRITPEVIALAIGCAAALGIVDVVYVARRVIPKIYLLDAVAESVLIAAWIVALTLR